MPSVPLSRYAPPRERGVPLARTSAGAPKAPPTAGPETSVGALPASKPITRPMGASTLETRKPAAPRFPSACGPTRGRAALRAAKPPMATPSGAGPASRVTGPPLETARRAPAMDARSVAGVAGAPREPGERVQALSLSRRRGCGLAVRLVQAIPPLARRLAARPQVRRARLRAPFTGPRQTPAGRPAYSAPKPPKAAAFKARVVKMLPTSKKALSAPFGTRPVAQGTTA